MTDTCDREIEEAEQAITELEKEMFTRDEYKKHMAEMGRAASQKMNTCSI